MPSGRRVPPMLRDPGTVRRPRTLPGAGVLLALSMLYGCGSGDAGEDSTQPTQGGTETSGPFAPAAEGPHRYVVTHENLGTCRGAADDGEETLEVAFGTESLTLTNIDFNWTQEFEQVGADEYYRSEGAEGNLWQRHLTFTAAGFVIVSETDDPVAVGEGAELQPCLRYTYTRIGS